MIYLMPVGIGFFSFLPEQHEGKQPIKHILASNNIVEGITVTNSYFAQMWNSVLTRILQEKNGTL